MSTINTYRGFAKFYDWYVKDFSADLPLYRHFCCGGHKILEIGCGTGRVLKSLAESGCNVLGVDISGDMLAVARVKLRKYVRSGRVRLANFDFTDSHLEEKFDRVLVTFYTLNYLLDENGCGNFIRNIRKSMNDNGLILIDLFYPRPLQKPESSGMWHEYEAESAGGVIKLRDKRAMKDGIEERIQEYVTAEAKERIISKRRFYSKQDIFRMLNGGGFSDIEFTDGYDIEGFHKLRESEAVVSNFVVKAEKKPE